MRALMLENADVRVLISAITFFTLLLILLAPDGYLVLALWTQGGFLHQCLSEKLHRKARPRGHSLPIAPLLSVANDQV
jgi:hypothetical protein